MDYEDFTELGVEISAAPDGGFQMTVLESPFDAGPPQAMELPYPLEKIAAVLRRIERSFAGGESREVDHENEDDDLRLPSGGDLGREVGHRLCETLFCGDARAKLLLSLGWVRGCQDAGSRKGLRLRLVFGAAAAVADETDLHRGHLNPLAALPWECLFDGHTGRHLGIGERTTVVRSVRGQFRVTPHPVTGRLRVLLVAGANPEGADDPLDLDEEARRIEGPEVADVRVFEGTRLDELRDTLDAGRYHVLHYMGHGSFAGDEGTLLFADGSAEGRPVTGQELAAHLADLPDLRLVVLNACRGAQLPTRPGKDPFLGVATALVAERVPAVVAMQFPIHDPIAIDFATQLYVGLVRGAPVDVAVGQWRRAVRHRSGEWLTPAVYLAGRTAQIFDPGYLVTKGREMREQGAPLRLGIRSFTQKTDRHPPAFARNMENENDLLLSLAPAFDGRFVRDPELWHTQVLPQLVHFLSQALDEEGRPLHLDMAAHGSIAFAAGYYLSVKAGLDVTLRQRGPGGTSEWRLDDGPAPEGPLWRVESHLLGLGERDVALGVSVAQPVVKDLVREDEPGFLREAGLPVRRLVHAEIEPAAGGTKVTGGAHAFALAEALVHRLKERSAEEKQGVLHLFVAAPNAFMFFLGRVARNLGTIQLYEYNFDDDPDHALYEPSIRLPPPPEAGGWRGWA